MSTLLGLVDGKEECWAKTREGWEVCDANEVTFSLVKPESKHLELRIRWQDHNLGGSDLGLKRTRAIKNFKILSRILLCEWITRVQ